MTDPVVKISEGLVKGSRITGADDVSYYSFLCIPYGKPIAGDLRFKAPQPVEPWQGIVDATKEGKSCFHKSPITKQYTGGEDCLSLHVFTKKLPEEENKLKPVMVFVHGGGFMFGHHDISTYGPDYLVNEDIVLVEITYRIGIIGFLHLNDSSLDVPGNAGLKDQALALKWVQRNIKSFNGDPNNVTLFGSSAGAASVEYLMLSPTCKGLFHKALTQSGSALNPWTRGYFDAADFASFWGKPHLTERELLKELTELSFEKLVDLQNNYIKQKNVPGNFGLFAPVKETPNPTAFLTKEPIEIIQSGEYNKVPFILGYNDDEGGLFPILQEIERSFDPDIKPFDIHEVDMKKLLPYETDLNDVQTVTKMTEIIKKYYLDQKHNNDHLMSDAYFLHGIITSAKQHAKVSNHPVYLYRFTAITKVNSLSSLVTKGKRRGALHGDEVGYLFKKATISEIGEIELKVRRQIISLWINFAKYGNPTPDNSGLNIKWKPIENGQVHFLDIGLNLKTDVNPEKERMKVWDQVYKCYPGTVKYVI